MEFASISGAIRWLPNARVDRMPALLGSHVAVLPPKKVVEITTIQKEPADEDRRLLLCLVYLFLRTILRRFTPRGEHHCAHGPIALLK